MPTSGDVPQKGGRNLGRMIFWLIATIIVVVLLYNVFAPATGDQVNEGQNGDMMMEDPVTTNYGFLNPEDWDGLERAETNIQDLAPGQRVRFGVVQDPADDNVVYFATSAFDVPTQSNLVSVYKYRNDDYTFERLFRTTYEQGNPIGLDERILPEFHAIGYEDGKLILLAMGVDDSPGPCANPYLIASGELRSLFTLDVNDPYAGFEDYIPSQELLEEKRAEEATCTGGFMGS